MAACSAAPRAITPDDHPMRTVRHDVQGKRGIGQRLEQSVLDHEARTNIDTWLSVPQACMAPGVRHDGHGSLSADGDGEANWPTSNFGISLVPGHVI
jgi:hypothetical protein